MASEIKYPREQLLDNAREMVTKTRAGEYGPVTEDFERTARILSDMGYTFNGNALQGADIAMLMIALKLSRLCYDRSKFDTWADIAGYAALGWENAGRL